LKQTLALDELKECLQSNHAAVITT
jgi:hypothetical protein